MRSKLVSSVVLTTLICTAALCGCQKTPQKDVILQKKSIEKVAQENKANPTGDGKLIREVVDAPKHSTFSVKDKKLKFNLKVDADVIMPEVSKVPIIEMQKNDVPSSRLEELTKMVFGNNKVVQENGKPLKYVFDKDNVDKGPEFVVAGKGRDGQKRILYVLHLPEESSANFDRDSKLTAAFVNGAATDKNTDNQCKYSKKKAIDYAQDIVNQLGLENQYKLASVSYEVASRALNEKRYVAKGYRIRFKRETHGILETDDATILKFNGKDENAVVPYGYEYMEFEIDDRGCEFWNWKNPMKEGKILSENVKLLPYSQILSIFKKQVKYTNAYGEQEYYIGNLAMGVNDTKEGFDAKVTKIIFGYMRVKNKGEGTYSLVPVWDFQGDINQGTSILTINAIDGTVIDRRLGY